METFLEGYIAEGPTMKGITESVRFVAPTNVSVVITGETGVGKEGIAQAIHNHSKRRGERFLAVNCGALVDGLAENEFFGHVKGAFTGAYGQKAGILEMANRGTVFLDEVGMLSLPIQAKLLRVFEGGTFYPVGSTEPKTTDVRIVAATNVPLEKLVQAGSFREDLYYRLMVLGIEVPPLRSRREEIPALVFHLLALLGDEMGRADAHISEEALAELMRREWRGNVRELKNVLERALVLCEGNRIERPHVFFSPTAEKEKTTESSAWRTLEEVEREHIRTTLEFCKWNRRTTARMLGVSYGTVLNKIRDWNLSPGK